MNLFRRPYPTTQHIHCLLPKMESYFRHGAKVDEVDRVDKVYSCKGLVS